MGLSPTETYKTLLNTVQLGSKSPSCCTEPNRDKFDAGKMSRQSTLPEIGIVELPNVTVTVFPSAANRACTSAIEQDVRPVSTGNKLPGQDWQLEVPLTLEYVFGGQGTGAPDYGSQYRPKPHSKQDEAPAKE